MPNSVLSIFLICCRIFVNFDILRQCALFTCILPNSVLSIFLICCRIFVNFDNLRQRALFTWVLPNSVFICCSFADFNIFLERAVHLQLAKLSLVNFSVSLRNFVNFDILCQTHFTCVLPEPVKNQKLVAVYVLIFAAQPVGKDHRCRKASQTLVLLF